MVGHTLSIHVFLIVQYMILLYTDMISVCVGACEGASVEGGDGKGVTGERQTVTRTTA